MRGVISLNDTLLLGPNFLGEFYPVAIRGSEGRTNSFLCTQEGAINMHLFQIKITFTVCTNIHVLVGVLMIDLSMCVF